MSKLLIFNIFNSKDYTIQISHQNVVKRIVPSAQIKVDPFGLLHFTLFFEDGTEFNFEFLSAKRIVNSYFSVEIDYIKINKPLKELKVQVKTDRLEGTFALDLYNEKRLDCCEKDFKDVKLEVLPFSQFDFENNGYRLCSPACLYMLANYYNCNVEKESLLRLAYDYVNNIYGNWFISSICAGYLGINLFVKTINSVGEIAEYLNRGIPIAVSVAYKYGEYLNGLSKTEGHFIIITGINSKGVFLIEPYRGKQQFLSLKNLKKIFFTHHRIAYIPVLSVPDILKVSNIDIISINDKVDIV